jgi:alkanesulfonate monooxygenase SsuD/methylene tetrahydromethanopterin reductase-like flavin-dependent oxidoreductase (luciferase family)
MVRLSVMLEPQEGMSYGDILAVAHRTEELGFEGLYRSDHYTSVAGRAHLGSTDAWGTLAGLARDTDVIRLGALVTPVTFRRAGNLAKVVATVSEMAGTAADGRARVELGLGTGWLEAEHRQYGFPFEDLTTRFRRLGEHLQIVTNLWDPDVETFTFDGEFEQLTRNRFVPKPTPRPRIIVGGRGQVRTPTLAVRYADELNTTFASPEECAALRRLLDRRCEDADRDPRSLALSLMTGCLVGADDADYRRRVQTLQARTGNTQPFGEYVQHLSGAWILGATERAAERLGRLREAGVDRVMLQHQLYDDLDMLDLVSNEVAPRL